MMVHNRFHWTVALRLLFSLKGQRFLAILSVTSLVLVVGTVALAYAISCISKSFSLDLRNKLLRARPHIEVAVTRQVDGAWLSALATDPEVQTAAPLIVGSALLQVGGEDGGGEGVSADQNQGVAVWGVGEESLGFFSPWSCRVFAGDAEDENGNKVLGEVLAIPADKHADVMMMGSELFRDLASAAFSPRVHVLYPFADVDPFGNSVFSEKAFAVRGICESGVYPIDRKVVIVPAPVARDLLGEYAWNRLWITLKDPFTVPAFLSRWGERLAAVGPVTTWQEANRTILSALRMERKVSTAVIAIVFVLASMSLYGMLSLHVIEKSADFAVLSVLGSRPRDILGIILRMSGVLALAGSGTGGVLGVALVYGLGHYPLPLPEAYYVRELFVGQDLFYLVLIIGLSVFVQVAASLVPALWLARVKTVSVLRFVEGGVV